MLTNDKVVELYGFLTSSFSNDIELSLRGNVILQKNIKALKNYVEDLKEIEKRYKKSEKIEEYEKKRIELLTPYLEKDEKGSFIIQKDGTAKPIQGTDEEDSKRIKNEIKKVLETINKEYEEPIKEYNLKLNEWNRFYLGEEAKVELSKISSDDFVISSAKKIRKSTFEALLHMIDVDLDKELGK